MRSLIDRVMTVRVILPLLIIYCHYVCSAMSTCNSIHKNTSIVIDGPCPAGTVISPNHLPVEFRCDYTSSTTDTWLPFWKTSLSKDRFLQGGGVVTSVSSASEGQSGHSKLTINATRLEISEYIISVGCGFCTLKECSVDLNLGIVSEHQLTLLIFGKSTHFGQPDKFYLIFCNNL